MTDICCHIHILSRRPLRRYSPDPDAPLGDILQTPP